MHNGWQTDSGGDDPTRAQITFMNWSTLFTVKFNVIKNNLFYDSPRSIPPGTIKVFGYSVASMANDQTFANNYDGDVSGDPLFVNATSTPGNPADVSYPDLSVKTSSPVIDAGGSLTTITSASGSGTSFVVADSSFFMDGWGIVQGDEIQLLGSALTAHITAVDYGTGSVTVDRALTWTKNQGVALSYAGSAPDAGAFETGFAPSAPTNLQVVSPP